MSEEAPTPPDTPALPPPRCINIMCKAMMVFGEAFESDPDYQAGVADFWCQCTQKPSGPDDGDVSLPLCSDPKRSCYRAF
jgi:hypothetical protein